MPDKSLSGKMLSVFCILYTCIFALSVSFLKFDFEIMKLKYKAINSAVFFIRSNEYKSIPLITKDKYKVS